jgi:hypothetical protein
MAVNVVGGALDFEASINLSNFEASLNRMQQGLNNLATTANNQSTAIENLASKAATAIGAYLSLNAAKGFVSELVNVRGEFEQLGVAFKVMLGNKEEADKLMAEAVQLAATTPFNLSEVASGAKQLLAYGTAAGDITKTLTMLGNVASGVGAPLNDLVYLYGTLQTQGQGLHKRYIAVYYPRHPDYRGTCQTIWGNYSRSAKPCRSRQSGLSSNTASIPIHDWRGRQVL